MEGLSDKNIIILKNDYSIRKFVVLKNNKTEFVFIKNKQRKTNASYLNSVQSKSLCIWKEKKFNRNKRTIIATGALGIIFTIPILAVIPSWNNREPFGAIFTTMSLVPIATTFNFTAIRLGIKRAVILKRSSKNVLNCNF